MKVHYTNKVETPSIPDRRTKSRRATAFPRGPV